MVGQYVNTAADNRGQHLYGFTLMLNYLRGTLRVPAVVRGYLRQSLHMSTVADCKIGGQPLTAAISFSGDSRIPRLSTYIFLHK